MADKLAPRPAATLLLLRDGSLGPEAFMLQRNRSAAFLAGAHVFPGGALDKADRDVRVLRRVAGLTDADASARMGVDSGGLAYWVAALRECFEEAGILLAEGEDGLPIDGARAAALAPLRALLHAGKLSFHEFLDRERLVLRAGELAYFGHWITAPGRARRFDTRFFLALAPQDQVGAHDGTELIDSLWLRPQDAIDLEARGDLQLVFATKNTLADLARFARAKDALEHAREADVETNRACWALGPDGAAALFRRRDPQYFEIHWTDPEETGQTSVALVPGEAKRLDQYVTRIVAPNPGMMTGPGTNTYLVGEGDLAVIDPGPAIDEHVRAVLEAGAGRIRWVLCTHTHLDHSPAAAAIKAATGAVVIGRPAPALPGQDQGFAPDRVLGHGDRFMFGGLTLRALHTPGHASNHLCYLLENTRMLFTGDHVMQGSTVVINPPDGDMRAYLASLELLLAEDVLILAPGHGYLIGEPHREVRRLVRHRLAREHKVVSALARLGAAEPDALVREVYDDVSARLHGVALRSLSAHLEKLAAEGRAHSTAGRWSLVQSPAAERSAGGAP
ncbi:MAG: MBL fold metallo-hydrolase [Betaproteobacteria bacterium]|nr:MBL fold metallo-hydrolase [Betaproteobacteria bacterium]MDH5221445.1 MBL fold metallo-hydrolase [Betaproteobacteria bacterium]MDH5352136.1 MBL fold metallo-hydrolase [Betaproteobacteria bacterium]